MLKLDHVAIEISDLDRAVKFYTEVLGLRLMFRQVDDVHHEAFAFLELGGGNLELLQRLDEDNQPAAFAPIPLRRSNCPHVALLTEDLEALLEHLKSAAVPLVKGPLEIPGQVRWAYFTDPDGNVLEFVQWTNTDLVGQ
jgi:catechol 2,3-dioxygenase-like lactoylglutathione lyase family enzyme